MRIALLAAVIALSTPAAADPVKVFEAQVAAMTRDGRDKLEKTLGGVHSLILVDARMMDAIATSLVAPSSSTVDVPPSVKSKVVGSRDKTTWIVADLEQRYTRSVDCPQHTPKKCERKRPLRMTELFVGGPKGDKLVSVHISAPAASGHETTDAVAGKTSTPSELAKLLANPRALADAFLDDPNVAVLGTDTKERAVGPKAVKKLLGSWSKLRLELEAFDEDQEGLIDANVVLRPKKGDPMVMRATLYYVTLPDGAKKVVVVHYSFHGANDFY